jgi:hypothetical protein
MHVAGAARDGVCHGVPGFHKFRLSHVRDMG